MRTSVIVAAGLLLLSVGALELRASPDEAAARNRQGVELLQAGKVAEAIVEFREAIELDPKNIPARLNLAYTLDRRGEIDQAVAEYKTAIEHDPDNAMARSNLGVLYDKKGQYEQAIQEFTKALEIDPGNAAVKKNLEVAMKNKAISGEREKNIADAKKEAEAHPKSGLAAYKLGRLYALYGDKERAIEWVGRAIKLGYREFEYMRVDRALDSVRSDPGFSGLLSPP